MTSIISGPTIFDFPTSIFNHFHAKIVSARRNTQSVQILYTVPPNNCIFRGEFLFVRKNVMRVLDLFFFISGQGGSTLHKIDHPMSYVPSNVVHLKN